LTFFMSGSMLVSWVSSRMAVKSYGCQLLRYTHINGSQFDFFLLQVLLSILLVVNLKVKYVVAGFQLFICMESLNLLGKGLIKLLSFFFSQSL
jgi:hypothetical protein